LQAQITQIRQQLTELQKVQPEVWCHDFNVNLKIGDSGSKVRALQTALEKEGFYERTITGYLDEHTVSAVVGFQEKYKEDILTPWRLTHGTGYVGSTTRAKLNELYGCKVSPTPSITVLSPNGGEVWEAGKTYDITWTSLGIDKVYIGLLIGDQLLSEYVIASNISASLGKYTWTIPANQPLSSKYKISIRAYGGIVFDLSDNYFSIAQAPAQQLLLQDIETQLASIGNMLSQIAERIKELMKR
jgi:hypothetical protein